MKNLFFAAAVLFASPALAQDGTPIYFIEHAADQDMPSSYTGASLAEVQAMVAARKNTMTVVDKATYDAAVAKINPPVSTP